MALKHFISAIAILVAGSTAALAQGVCPVGQPVPVSSGASSYTLTAGDQCAFLIFTGGTPVTITAPTASSLNVPTFQVTLMSTGAPITVTSTSNINGSTADPTMMGYSPMVLMGDGTNYWLFQHGPTPVAGQYTMTTPPSSLIPGTTLDGSPYLQMGNGVLKWSNQASWQAGVAPAKLAWNGCGYAPPGWGQAGPSWLMVFDNLGLRRYIPTC